MIERALEIARDAGDKRGEATALWWLGKANLATADFDAARVSLGGGLRAFQAFDMFAELVGCLEDHAMLLNSVGNLLASARLCASAERFRETLVLPRTPRDQRKWQADVARLRAALDAASLEQVWSEGRTWEVGDAVNCALTASYATEEVAIA
jgi:hypothetical protein